jgi:hypothetical protein
MALTTDQILLAQTMIDNLFASDKLARIQRPTGAHNVSESLAALQAFADELDDVITFMQQ